MFATVFILLATDKAFMTALQHSTLSALEDGCIAHAAKQAGLTGTRPLTVSDYSPSSTAFSAHYCANSYRTFGATLVGTVTLHL